MSEVRFRRVLPEPAHPMVVRLHDDLVAIYTLIREKCQAGIDQAFDRASREIGFVVATALPFTFELADDRVKGLIITEALQGTIFDRELGKAINEIADDPVPIDRIADDPMPIWRQGAYSLYLFWFEALKLKLRTDWMEPAHVSIRLGTQEIRKTKEWLKRTEIRGDIEGMERGTAVAQSPWEEPAHWFDPGTMIAAEEGVLISAIDEVYPELKLVDRISHYRRGMGSMLGEQVGSGAQLGEQSHGVLMELKELLGRYGY